MNLPRLRRRLQGKFAGRALLGLLSALYGLAVWTRDALYTLGLLPSRRLGARTICFGNLTAGGTGKTSAVLLAAQTLHKRQLSVAILSRGYRRPRRTREVVVLSGPDSPPWQQTGDEPWMLHRALKGLPIPILVSPDRYRAGRIAMERYGARVLLMDDGFQHRRLGRDLDVVLLSARDPFGGGHLLPLGELREPLRALRRARLAVITHADQVPKKRLEEIRATISALHPQLQLAESVHRADFLLDLKSELRHKPVHLKDKRVACFSAIGEPGSFEAELRRLGAELAQVWRFPDHYPYRRGDLRSIENARGGLPVVTTFKDLPRLPSGWQGLLSGEVLALGVKLEIVKGKAAWEAALCDEPIAAE